MALNGIGGGDAGSALERFQRIRDSAKKKLEVEDRQSDLAGLVKRKQAELGIGNGAAARPSAERIPPGGPAAAPASGKMAPGAGAGTASTSASTSAYGRAGGLDRPDPKPSLGRFVDFMA